VGELRLKPHPLEAEIDRVVTDLGGDLLTMKHVTSSGIMYNFIFNAENDGGVAAYFSLPTYVPTRENLIRLEFTIGDKIKAEDLGQILLAITLDQDLQRYNVLRVVPRSKDLRTYEILLQCVCHVGLVQGGFVATTIIAGLELAEFYRTEFLTSQKKAA